MVRLATQILGNRSDAEDAVQEAFLVAFRKAGGFRGESSASTWLHRVLINTCLKMRERRRPAASLEDPGRIEGPREPAPIESAEIREVLQLEIAALPLRQRIVFTLSEVEGTALEEIAAILALRSATVRYHLFKARERLRERLRPRLDETELPLAERKGRET
jgi:RNA polymerase sigma-70 factor (ECF subfamily)